MPSSTCVRVRLDSSRFLFEIYFKVVLVQLNTDFFVVYVLVVTVRALRVAPQPLYLLSLAYTSSVILILVS